MKGDLFKPESARAFFLNRHLGRRTVVTSFLILPLFSVSWTLPVGPFRFVQISPLTHRAHRAIRLVSSDALRPFYFMFVIVHIFMLCCSL